MSDQQHCPTCGRALPDHIPAGTRAIPDMVAEVYGLTVNNLTGRDRRFAYVQPRQVCWLLLYERGLTYEDIGRAFGHRHHTTVLYGVREARERAKHDRATGMTLEYLREHLRTIDQEGAAATNGNVKQEAAR